MAGKSSRSNWISSAINPKNKGSLHRSLKVKQGQKIPMSKLQKAAKGSGKTAQRARLAMTLRKFH